MLHGEWSFPRLSQKSTSSALSAERKQCKLDIYAGWYKSTKRLCNTKKNNNQRVKCKLMICSIVGPLNSHLWFMAILKSMQGTTSAYRFPRHKAWRRVQNIKRKIYTVNMSQAQIEGLSSDNSWASSAKFKLLLRGLLSASKQKNQNLLCDWSLTLSCQSHHVGSTELASLNLSK